MRRASSTLLARGSLPFVGQQMFYRRQQEGTEAAFALMNRRERLVRQQSREKLLREILRVLGTVTLSPNISIKRWPIGAAKLLQGYGGLRVLRIPHHAPEGARELSTRVSTSVGA